MDWQTLTCVPNLSFKQALDQVLFVTRAVDVVPAFTGVRFRFDGDRLTLVATDGFRLSCRVLPVDPPVEPALSAVIAAGGLKLLRRQLASIRGRHTVEIKADPAGKRFLFTVGQAVVVADTIPAEYPEWRKLFPDKPAATAVVKRETLLALLRTANRHFVGLEIDAGALRISVFENLQEKYAVQVAVQGVGTARAVFDPSFLRQALRAVQRGQVLLVAPSSAVMPWLIMPADGGDFWHLVMSMKWEVS